MCDHSPGACLVGWEGLWWLAPLWHFGWGSEVRFMAVPPSSPLCVTLRDPPCCSLSTWPLAWCECPPPWLLGPQILTFYLLFVLHAHLVHSAPPSDPQCPSLCLTWHVLPAVSPSGSPIPCQALPAPSPQSSALLEGRGGQGQCSQQAGCCEPYTSCVFPATCRPRLPSVLVDLLLPTLWAYLLAPLW